MSDNARRRRTAGPRRADPAAQLPDVRDGLTHLERVVLEELRAARADASGRRISAAELYGRVVEREAVSVEAFSRVLRRLTGA